MESRLEFADPAACNSGYHYGKSGLQLRLSQPRKSDIMSKQQRIKKLKQYHDIVVVFCQN